MSDLIERLRSGDYYTVDVLEAADAIETASARIAEFERILDGLPQDAIDGGWTARGISAYAKQLEARVAELDAIINTLHEPARTAAERDVLAERERQVTAEGWTPAHDDEHDDCEMALAAIVYSESAVGYHASCPDTWPWSPKWFKPTTPRRDLVKAAALVLAEIERIDRAAQPKATKTGEPA